jgi:hypothetical protein
MRKALAKGVLAVGLGAMAMLSQGCKRKAPVAAPAAEPRVAPKPRFETFPEDNSSVPDDAGVRPPVVRHRRREMPVVAPVPATQPSAAPAEEEQRQRDAQLLLQQEAASRRQQQELNRMVQDSEKEQQEEQSEPRIEEAPGPAPGPRIQEAPGPPPGPRIQDAPGPSQTQPPPPSAPQG